MQTESSLTRKQFDLLCALAEAAEPMTQRQLREATGHSFVKRG